VEVYMTAALSKWSGAVNLPQPSPTVANIVLPLDGSAVSRAAVPVARGLAQLYKAVSHLLYVGEAPPDPKNMLSLLGVTREDMPGAVVDTYEGDAAEGIAGTARQLPESLIVMCTHTGAHGDLDHFGSVAEAVLASSPERIVLLAPDRGDKPWCIQRVLLAHDGTRVCDAAAASAAELSLLGGAEVIALHVAARKAASPEGPGNHPAPRYIDQPQHEWPAWTGEFTDRMLALGRPPSSVHFNLVVAGGQPGSEIANLARERQADIVVMAWHGQWEHARHIATRVVLRAAGCPVLLVRAKSE
jgi:nucleotide-binding universal stress UspA family protein